MKNLDKMSFVELEALEQQLKTQEQQLRDEINALEAEAHTRAEEDKTIQLIFERQYAIREMTDYKTALENILEIKDPLQFVSTLENLHAMYKGV